jgi:hypothetical protein
MRLRHHPSAQRTHTANPSPAPLPRLDPLIRRPGRNPAVSPRSFTCGGDPTGSVHLVSLASRPALLSRLLSTQPRIEVREPIRSAEPAGGRGACRHCAPGADRRDDAGPEEVGPDDLAAARVRRVFIEHPPHSHLDLLGEARQQLLAILRLIVVVFARLVPRVIGEHQRELSL